MSVTKAARIALSAHQEEGAPATMAMESSSTHRKIALPFGTVSRNPDAENQLSRMVNLLLAFEEQWSACCAKKAPFYSGILPRETSCASACACVNGEGCAGRMLAGGEAVHAAVFACECQGYDRSRIYESCLHQVRFCCCAGAALDMLHTCSPQCFSLSTAAAAARLVALMLPSHCAAAAAPLDALRVFVDHQCPRARRACASTASSAP